ncbi:unnamed protein product, partial [Sphacelaria rigidula]
AAVTAATSVSGKTSKLLWSGLDGLRVRRVPAGESTDEDDEDTEAQMPSRPTVRLGGHSDNLARGAALTRTPTAVRLSDPPERGFDMSLPDRDTTG